MRKKIEFIDFDVAEKIFIYDDGSLVEPQFHFIYGSIRFLMGFSTFYLR
jgi:hypothetical protein